MNIHARQEPVQRLIWLLSPYHTGSHRAWAEGYARHSRHNVRLLTMDGRFWKWRMQGGALHMAQLAQETLQAGAPDAILCTDMLNLPAWLGLMRQRLPPQIPVLLYMHENQLTYPWRAGEKPDLTYALINWLSQCCAQRIAFNSDYHRQSWFDALPNLLKHFPDYTHLSRIEDVRAASCTLPVGIALPDASRVAQARAASATHDAPPLILWNQRWEYDKQPERFFALLYRLQEAGIVFRVAVAGENFRNVPAEFEEARVRLADHVAHWGFVESRAAYEALLAQADVVISTAIHEFFGISILEAIAAGAFPLLPRRLSYPELLPAPLHKACLYDDEDALFTLAAARLQARVPAPSSLRAHVAEHFGWPTVARAYDDWVERNSGIR